MRITAASRLAEAMDNVNAMLCHRVQNTFETAQLEIFALGESLDVRQRNFRHVEGVLRYLDQLLAVDWAEDGQPEIPMSWGETFLLLCSAILHESGHDVCTARYSSGAKVLLDRGQIAAEAINKGAKLQLGDDERSCISSISRFYAVGDYRQRIEDEWSIEGLGRCRLHVIAATLRIAALLQFTSGQLSSFVLEERPGLRAMDHRTEKSPVITDVSIKPTEKLITIYSRPRSVKQLHALLKYVEWLDGEVSNRSRDLAKVGLSYRVELKSDNQSFQTFARGLAAENPFIGPRPFEADEADLFFGRDSHVDKIIGLIDERRFLALVGGSGVGKTSLVNCGIIPELIGRGSKVVQYRFNPPGSSVPISESFRDCVVEQLRLPRAWSWQSLMAHLRSSQPPGSAPLVVYIDQFEELFTLHEKSPGKSEFLAQMLSLFSHEYEARVFVTMREEFLTRLWLMAQDMPDFFDRDGIYPVWALDKMLAREAIERPLERFSNLRWDSSLVELLLEHLVDQGTGIFPPYLQLVCQRLVREKLREIGASTDPHFENRHTICQDLYEKLGKTESIIKDYFQSILDRFTHDERVVIDEVLAKMITDYGYRKPVLEGEIEELNRGRIDISRAMSRLVDSRVVKRRHYWYELEHDILARELVTLIRKPSIRASGLIQKAVQHIEANLNRSINLAQLKSVTGLGASQLTRRFKNETGFSPTQLVTKLRVDAAKELLYATENPIQAIARDCGFQSVAHFNELFKRHTKSTPRQYRKEIREARSREFTRVRKQSRTDGGLSR